MIKIQFLGTCAGVPSKNRNVSSLIIQMLQYQNECWLFDCGEATQHQLLNSAFTLSKINKIFISHLHGDHIFGLPGLLGSRSFQGGTSKLHIFGPKGLKDFIHTTLTISNTYVRYPLEIDEIEEGTIFANEDFVFEAVKLEHGISSFGYRITEKDQPGTLDVEKLQEKGIFPGPMFKELKEGKKLEINGEIINGADFLGPIKKGKIIAVAGDTRPCDGVLRLAKDANILIHEATFLDEDKDLANEHYHSTARQAASVAVNCDVKILFLNHISSRYREAKAQYLQEAQSIFANSYFAEDFDLYWIKQDDSVSVI